ncbi:MAG: peptide-modifying radical SAM enzyme CbpB [Deltaproteobacteria bacterium]|nr:peptide-modifying radical SAM enzyme CbpB [Deltaproteobacteria bacterium]MBW2087647.1 peptide-modifying radical SAM enzyme CbpB [Deltaproteobacteria bacterium]
MESKHCLKTAAKNIRYANTGYGPQLSVIDIGLTDKVAVIEPDSAFWALVEKDSINELFSGSFVKNLQEHIKSFQKEMEYLRFGLKPSAVYFNPTERCNLNCTYCYLPEDMRREGTTMTNEELCDALDRLHLYFKDIMPEGERPQIIFHGSEPMLAKKPMFAGIKKFNDKFHFGLQTNATLLDDDALSFLMDYHVGIGISLDGPSPEIADITRKNWQNSGAFNKVVEVLDKLVNYPAFNVITTVTTANVHTLPEMVDFYHEHQVNVVMFNPVRCTQKGGMELKPENDLIWEHFSKALDRTWELFKKTNHKLVIANFANVLAGITGPTGRRLMCDISPCGGGRCFFAVSANGDVFPCSEFIGFAEFKGGNLFRDDLHSILKAKPIEDITNRKVENIFPCNMCAIRHFCGAPCPAEVKMLSGDLDTPSPYCEFYEEQVRYAFKVIAHKREDAYLWDGWKDETEITYNYAL